MARTVASQFGFTNAASAEPSLDDLFAEPIIRMIMARDHVNVSDMRTQLDGMRQQSLTRAMLQASTA